MSLVSNEGCCRRILIAEDEAVTALALEHVLEGQGYRICGIATTGVQARSIADSARPALAIIDMRLKDGLTGHAAAADIRSQLGIPVILMSGHSDEASARRAGAVGFLPKPFSDHELVKLVDFILRAPATEPVGRVPGLLVPATGI
jgi:DNA-binding response OmpR family regulator